MSHCPVDKDAVLCRLARRLRGSWRAAGDIQTTFARLLLLPVLGNKPLAGGFFAEQPPPVFVTDPILGAHRGHQRFGLFGDCLYLLALLDEEIEALLHSLARAPVGAARVESFESGRFDCDSHQSA